MAAVRGRHGLAVALVSACLVVTVVGAPPTALGQTACSWTAELLPLPDNVTDARVTAGNGDWLAGTTGSGEGVLWQRGRLALLGRAFGATTRLEAVNSSGVAVGTVTGVGRTRAVRYRDGYEYLPGTAALDVNPSGDTVGYDGAALVVWPATGGVRRLPMPLGEHAYDRPSIDDDGTVVARTGWLDASATFRMRVHTWSPDGSLGALTAGDDTVVEDIRLGRVVGSGARGAVVWSHGDWTELPGGATAVAVNPDGQVVGVAPNAQNLIWPDGERLPRPLPPPWLYQPGAVTALNDHEAGGYAFAPDYEKSIPVRWRCRSLP